METLRHHLYPSRPVRPSLWVVVWLLMMAHRADGQAWPVEVMAGDRALYYQHGLARAIRDGSRFGVSHVASFHAFHDERTPPEVMGQAYATYAIHPALRVAAGGFYASGPGFRPSMGLQWTHRWERINLMLVPRTDLRERPSLELMGLLEYTPRAGERSGPYARLQVMVNAGPEHHNRSYHYFRLGWSLGATRLGMALNMDSYGACRCTYPNAGLFIRQIM